MKIRGGDLHWNPQYPRHRRWLHPNLVRRCQPLWRSYSIAFAAEQRPFWRPLKQLKTWSPLKNGIQVFIPSTFAKVGQKKTKFESIEIQMTFKTDSWFTSREGLKHVVNGILVYTHTHTRTHKPIGKLFFFFLLPINHDTHKKSPIWADRIASFRMR